MKTLLWLDDIRNPLENNWLVFSPIEQPFELVWVKSYTEFTLWIFGNGLPDAICFDHDLGKDEFLINKLSMSKRQAKKLRRNNTKTGKDCANWLVDYCLDNDLDLPLYNIQSANPVGKENIDGLLKGYIKYRTNGNNN